MEEKRFLDIQNLADYIHMSESYVYKMVSKKSIPHIKLGSRTLFERNQIDKEYQNFISKIFSYSEEPKINFFIHWSLV